MKRIAENKLLDFAGAGMGEVLDLHPDIRGFLRRHVCAAMGVQFGLVEQPRTADERADDLAPVRVWQADHSDIGHARVFQQAVLDLGWEMVLATADDHLFDAAGDGDVPALIHSAQIASIQPTHCVDSLGRSLGVVVVFQHDTWAARANLSDRTNVNIEGVIDAAYRNLRLSHRLAAVLQMSSILSDK